MVKLLLDNGAAIDAEVGDDGRTALHRLAVTSAGNRRCCDTAKVLLEHGASLTVQDHVRKCEPVFGSADCVVNAYFICKVRGNAAALSHSLL